jgi:DNA-dependent RNA polymerase auxiliary subunit epsilon
VATAYDLSSQTFRAYRIKYLKENEDYAKVGTSYWFKLDIIEKYRQYSGKMPYMGKLKDHEAWKRASVSVLKNPLDMTKTVDKVYQINSGEVRGVNGYNFNIEFIDNLALQLIQYMQDEKDALYVRDFFLFQKPPIDFKKYIPIFIDKSNEFRDALSIAAQIEQSKLLRLGIKAPVIAIFGLVNLHGFENNYKGGTSKRGEDKEIQSYADLNKKLIERKKFLKEEIGKKLLVENNK